MTRDDPAAFAPPPAFGPFRVLHQIGVGALGPVFRTYEPTRDRLIAVKVFRLDATPEQAQALADELSRAADAGLFHPSIVEPVAAGVEGTVAYRAEEYVAAESLDVAIRHYAPASLDKALPFLTQLAGAIDFARAAGVGHGALHLRDIFVTPEEARASGFGVVEALERAGLRAPVRRPYTAPERIAGARWGTPADVFSLGAIAYELLTGRRPSGTGERIGPLNGAVIGEHADRVHAVLVRAMADDPADRYQSALGFASALEAAARGERVTGAVEQVGVISGAVAAPAVVPRDVPPAPAEETADQDLIDRQEMDLERELDEAHHGLTVEEQARMDALGDPGPAPRMLFEDEEDEAVEDLALEPPPSRPSDDAGAAAAPVPAHDSWAADESGASAPYDEPRSAGIVEPHRAAVLPLAVTLVIGLLVGFFAGYTIGGRNAAAPGGADADPAAAASSQAGGEAGAETGQPAAAGRPYSEQAVGQPPAAPPAVAEEAPAERPSPPPAPTTGRIVVRSAPSRAGVTVNNRWRGRTPLTLDKAEFGRYSVRVVRDGYDVAREEFSLSAAEPSRTLSFTLQRTPARRGAAAPPQRSTEPPARPSPSSYFGSIYVDSRPRGARVLLDGKAVGTTPMRLPEVLVGAHVVRLELEDHRAWTTSTRVAAGQDTRVTGSLERIR